MRNVEELMRLGFAVSKAVSDSLSDGKWGFMDLMNFLPVMGKIGPAMEGIADVKAEFAQASKADLARMAQVFREEFDLEDDSLEEKIELAFEAGLSIAKMVMELR